MRFKAVKSPLRMSVWLAEEEDFESLIVVEGTRGSQNFSLEVRGSLLKVILVLGKSTK